MGHEGQEILIKDALVFLFAAGVLVPLARGLRVPAVLAFIFAGLLLGPSGLGALAERWPLLGIVTIADPEAAAPFAELGVLFLLFLLGLKLSFERLWALRRVVFGAGALQVGLSALAIAAVARLAGLETPAAITVGLALALSSTAIVMQLLVDERRVNQPVGRAALGVLLFQDLMVAPILIFVSFARPGGGAGLLWTVLEALFQGALALGVIFLIGRFLLRRGFHQAAHSGGRDLLMALTLLTVVGAAVITAGAGLSLALGAFLAGLLLGETEFKHQTEVDLEPFKGLLLGVFFMSVGMALDLSEILPRWGQIGLALVALLGAKAAIAILACRRFAGGLPLSIETAALLAPAGEFAFVVLATAGATGVLARESVTFFGAVAGLSMVCIPLLDSLGTRIAARWPADAAAAGRVESYAELDGHVVVAGFGRVGQAIVRILMAEETDFVLIDRNVRRVALCHDEGWKIQLGDAARPEFLERAGARGAAMFIVTVDDADSAERIVRAVRSLRPDAPILARARDTDHAAELAAAGASFVIPDAIEAGLQMAGRALVEFGYSSETVRSRISAVREAEYRSATDA